MNERAIICRSCLNVYPDVITCSTCDGIGKEIVVERRTSLPPVALTPETKVYRGVAWVMLTILFCYAVRFLIHFHAAVKP